MSIDYANILRLSYSHLYDLSPPAPASPDRTEWGKCGCSAVTTVQSIFGHRGGAGAYLPAVICIYSGMILLINILRLTRSNSYNYFFLVCNKGKIKVHLDETAVLICKSEI